MKRILVCLAVSLILTFAAAAPAAALSGESYYSIGSQWAYTLVHQVQVYNNAADPATDIVLRVPLADAPAGTPYCQAAGVEYLPYPDEIVSAADGSRMAVYRIASLGPYESLTLSQRYAVKAGEVSYGFDRAAVGKAYSPDELESLAPYMDASAIDPAVLSFAQAGRGASDNMYQIARNLFAAVNLKLDYANAASADQSAAVALARGSGNCEGYANLYLEALRACGLAARPISGYLFQPATHVSRDYVDLVTGDVLLNNLGHTWVEFYLPALGWVPADPTFTYTFNVNGVEQKLIKWNHFAEVNAANRYICFRGNEVSNGKMELEAGPDSRVGVSFTAKLTTGLVYTPFGDVLGHWAREPVMFCVEEGLFSGVSERSFAPDASMTRAMFVTVLGRLYEKLGYSVGLDASSISRFTDIDGAAYYAAYLGWAVRANIISGYPDNSFRPDEPVTREQMAAMLAAFLHAADAQAEPQTLVMAHSFRDSSKISFWALNGVATCAANGLISGYPGNTFRPNEKATRAQVASILQRLCQWLDEQPTTAPEQSEE